MRELPADALLKLGGLAGLLALLEAALCPRSKADDEGEEAHHPEGEEGDHLVVGLAHEALAVVVRHRRDGEREREQQAQQRREDPTLHLPLSYGLAPIIRPPRRCRSSSPSFWGSCRG